MEKYLCLLFLGLLFCACEKEDLREEYIKWIDPETEPDRLCRQLNVDGDNLTKDFPTPVNPELLSIVNSQSSALTSNNTALFVPFTYSGNGMLTGIYLKVVGATNYWDIPVSLDSSGTSFTFQVGIPDRVLQGDFKLIFSLYDDLGNVSEFNNMSVGVTPVQSACSGGNTFVLSGSAGLTVQRIELGNTPGKVSISYQMYTLPDRLDILYNGEWVATTDVALLSPSGTPPASVCFDGTDGYVSGTGTLTFDYDPAMSQEFHIYMYGCFGATAWDFGVTCPEDQICTSIPEGVGPSWTHKEMTFEADLEGRVPSGLWVNEGDYVFFGAEGSVIVDKKVSILHGTTHLISSSAKGISGNEESKKYDQFRFGQLILSVGNQRYPCEKYTLKGRDCDWIPDEFISDNIALINEYGDYFIVEESGFIDFELNDNKIDGNKLAFNINMYVLTEDQHRCRNFFNQCPEKRPAEDSDGDYRDNKDYLWEDKFYDGLIEDCYHGGFVDFRGTSQAVLGCQCVYNGQAVVNEDDQKNLGTFDYGYWNNPLGNSPVNKPSVRLHMILDVFPHIAYLNKDENFLYTPTPPDNIY